MIKIIFLVTLALSINLSMAKAVKVSVIAPEGTTLANAIGNMAKEVKKLTKNRVNFKIYYSGVNGDEPVVLQKIHINQQQGSFFTGKTLGDIAGDIRVMELPFNFIKNADLATTSLEVLEKDFEEILDKKGFVSLGFIGIGEVYLITTKKVSNLKELQGIKIWSWQGDELVKAMMEELGCVTVPLALPDVLASLSSGIVEATYAPPLGILALQWHTKVKYLVNVPAAYSIGAFVLSKKAWSTISKEDQEIVLRVAKEEAKKANEKSKKENIEALEQIKKYGIEFVDFPSSEVATADSIRSKVITKIQDKLVSKKMIEKFEALRSKKDTAKKETGK